MRVPTIFDWVLQAPSIIEKINRLVHSAQIKNWTTTAAVMIALSVQVAQLLGVPISHELAEIIETAVIFVIGLFTGVQVINPQYEEQPRV